MKTNKILNALFIASLFGASVLFTSCGPKTSSSDDESSKEIAEDQNEEKFEDADKEDDADFVVDAADDGMLEVQLAELAMANSTMPAVKEFAATIKADHSKANDELKALAMKKNISIPAALGDDNQKTYNDLKEKTGEDFDKDYCKLMVKDHNDDIDAFKKEAEKGTDEEIRTWAAGKLADLEHHLMMAQNMEETMKAKK